MLSRCLVVLLCLVAGGATARDKFSTRPLLSDEDAIWLAGSSIAVVRHPAPRPRVQTITGNIFAGGVIGLTSINKASRETARSEPSDILEQRLAPAVAGQFGAKLAPQPLLVKGSEWADVAAAPTDAAYLLDLRTTRLAVEYRRNLQNEYWVGYGVRVALVERATARLMFVSNCYTDTVDHPGSPRLKDLEENGSRLLADVMDSLAWKCMQKVAVALLPKPDDMPRPPRNLVDPLADYARTNPRE
jgi:hypothetical protein